MIRLVIAALLLCTPVAQAKVCVEPSSPPRPMLLELGFPTCSPTQRRDYSLAVKDTGIDILPSVYPSESKLPGVGLTYAAWLGHLENFKLQLGRLVAALKAHDSQTAQLIVNQMQELP